MKLQYPALVPICGRGRGFYRNGQIFVKYRQKLSMAAMTRQETIWISLARFAKHLQEHKCVYVHVCKHKYI